MECPFCLKTFETKESVIRHCAGFCEHSKTNDLTKMKLAIIRHNFKEINNKNK